MPRENLAEYRRKRDFQSTPEPEGHGPASNAGPLSFVVHRHDARRLHYDLRLEADGVLMSFAIPRGPSARTGDKRLAVRTEDHPLDYASFEGVIPKGQYGAGTSIIWDAGTYSPDDPHLLFDDRDAAEAAVRAGLERGKLSLTFRGKKLKGSWALVKTAEAWLLLKHRDGAADAATPLVEQVRSVASGRTNAELLDAPGVSRGNYAHFAPQTLRGSRAAPVRPVKPMLASAGKPIPDSGWSYEPKLDGIRLIATMAGGSARLISRGGHDITAAYPALARAIEGLPAASLVIDGEIVARDGQGRPSFELLQQRMNLQDAGDIARAEASLPVTCYVFDLLHLDGFDLAATPLEERREVLARVLLPGGPLREVATIDLPSADAFEAAVSHGFEGIIAKRDGSRYEAGRRSDSWRKWKAVAQGVFVVGGYTRGEGSRAASFGGLLLGERVGEGFAYRGRVGTGFSDAQARELRAALDELAAATSPFNEPVRAERTITWVKPELEVVVEFAERTEGGALRAPSYKGRAAEGVAVTPIAEANESVRLRDQIGGERKAMALEGDGWSVRLTNLDRVLWPGDGEHPAVTKRDLLLHAVRVWPLLAPHLRDRLLTVTRYPSGLGGEHFYQRHLDAKAPVFVETVAVYSETEGKAQRYMLCNNLATLLYLCQQAALEWHMSLARVSVAASGEVGSRDFAKSAETLAGSVLNHPDILLFDLDSYLYRGDERRGQEPQPNDAGFEAARKGAFAVKTLLDELSLPGFVKTSGKTGLHICVPLVRSLDYAGVRAFATTLGKELVRRHPRLLTMEWQSTKRRGKVFVDVNQNARARAIAAPFSPRAHPGAPVSVPVSWRRLESQSWDSHSIGTDAPADDAWEGFASKAVDLRGFLGLE